MPPAKKQRLSVGLDTDDIVNAFEKIGVKTLKGGKLVSYSEVNFKKAPRWGEMKPYLDTVNSLLTKSNGRNVKQTSMVEGAKAFKIKNDLKFTDEDLERASYALRAMISQLANHQNKDDQV